MFYNYSERRPRALWRLLFQVVLYLVGAALLVNLAFVAFALSSEDLLGDGAVEVVTTSPAFWAASSATSLVAAVASMWLAGRFFDRRLFSGFGLRLDRAWWLDLCFGLALGALLMAGIFSVELAAGWITVTGTFETADEGPFAIAILFPLVTFLCVGISEELFSRGYQLTNIAEGLDYPDLGARGAVLMAWAISSLLFGLLHLSNPGATAISTINIAFAGLLLGVGYILTGRLAIPIGLHITWNFFQGNVFGFPVSGLEPIGAMFISIEQGGPTLFTGGVFGPEAGLLGIAATIVGSLLIWLWVRARHGKATIQTSIAKPPGAAPPDSKTEEVKTLRA
ncbi:MAG TPA: type II CAAX endopeptidase family protein [Rubrobacteraceae bacterium]|nr:type II CAAX endopeptidase family protein [Rubrobacteraceae bacterium]